MKKIMKMTTLQKKEKTVECFRFYDEEFIYPVFSYCLLATLISQLDNRLKPKVVLQICAKEANILQYYKNLLTDINISWGKIAKSYSVKKTQNILKELTKKNFEDTVVIWNVEDNSYIKMIKEIITKMQTSLKNNQYYEYPFTALPLICSKYNNTSDEIYTVVLKKSTKNRNEVIINELGNYIYNFLFELYSKFYNESIKAGLNQELRKKYGEYISKFPECVGEKPLTWLRFECLLISIFSYFIDITLYDEATEEKEQLLRKAESAILGIKFQDDKQVLFDKIFEKIILFKNNTEKILSERPKDDLVDQFLKNESQIGFITEIDKIGKVLCLKPKFLEEFLSERNIDKTEFLDYIYENNKLHYNTTKDKVRYDASIPLKKGNQSINKKFNTFLL